ncbi:hypothetical protein CR513_57256, partial [Mucuna pruriens]
MGNLHAFLLEVETHEKNCLEYATWHAKKGRFLIFVCSKWNFVGRLWCNCSHKYVYARLPVKLSVNFHLNLVETCVASSIRHNLIYTLDNFGYSCSFANIKVSLSYDSNVGGCGSLIDNLLCLILSVLITRYYKQICMTLKYALSVLSGKKQTRKFYMKDGKSRDTLIETRCKRFSMSAQVCTCLDITFIVGVLGRYMSNPNMQNTIK